MAASADRLRVWALGLALGYGAMRQGAFYADQFHTVLALVGLAVAARLFVPRPVGRHALLTIGALGSLAVWAGVSGLIVGDFNSALPIAGTSLCVAGGAYASTGLTAKSRGLLSAILLIVGAIVSFTSWAGVAWHYQPWALPSQALWRGASTLTYSNAAAAFLFTAMMVAVERWLSTSRSSYLFVLFGLTVGWIATLSRAAGTSLFIALVVLMLLMRGRRRLLGLWPVALTSVIAAAALLPSLPENSAARPALAIAGVAAAVMLLAGFIIGPQRVTLGVLAIVVVIGGAWAFSNNAAGRAVNGIDNTRLDAQSSDRTDLLRVTWDQFKAHPLVGVGPGRIDFDYVNHDGEEVVAEFTHNEYLQLAAELGVLGGLLAIAIVALLALQAVAGTCVRSDAAILGLALVTAFGFHSALDFLWHLPELPLFGVVAVGTLNFRDGR